MTPEKIGRYTIVEELGRGGMATVYRAHDPRFDREVAVKVLPRQFTYDPTFRTRFEREARTIAALEHPAIVPVYDYGEQDDQPFLVMRLMTGGSLAGRLQDGPLALDETLAIMQRIGSALDRAHELGVVHRDLKPDNILFDQYGDAFLADFGIARLAEATGTLTGTGVIGTPAYMSPEQIQGGDVDGRTDIYALGIILFEMLTGEKPYKAETPAMVLVKQMTEPVPRILDVKPELPPGCELVIAKAMAKEQAERYATATELCDTLTATTKPSLPPTAPPPESPPETETAEFPTDSPVEPQAAAPVKPEVAPDVTPEREPEPDLVSEETAVATDPTVEEPKESPPVPQQRGRLRRWLVGCGVALVLGCLGILILGILSNRTTSPSGDGSFGDTGGNGSDAPPVDFSGIVPDNVGQMEMVSSFGRGTVEAVALSPNGRILAVGGSLGVWLYDAKTLEPQELLQGHEDLVSAVAWSPDSQRLASASWDQTIRIWDAATGRQQALISGEEQFTALAWSPAGDVLASATWLPFVDIWDAESGQLMDTLEGHEGWIETMAFTPDSSRLAAAGDEGVIHVWSDAGEYVTLPGHEGFVGCVAWSPDGSMLASCGEDDGTVRLWDAARGEMLHVLEGHEHGVYALHWFENSKRLVSAGDDGTVRLWNVKGALEQILLELMAPVDQIVSLPQNENFLLVTGNDRLLQVGSNGRVQQEISEHTNTIRRVAWSPDGTLVAATGIDTAIRIWDVAAGAPAAILPGHKYGVLGLAWSPDGTHLISSGEDGNVRVWEWETGQMVNEWWPGDTVIATIAWSPDGEWLSFGDANGRIHVQNVDDENEGYSWQGHDDGVEALVWSPDGDLLASGGWDGMVFVWEDVAGGADEGTGEAWRIFPDHEGEVTGVAWSPDGRFLATGSLDQTVRVWDVAEDDEVQRLEGHHDLVTAVAWSPNGPLLASGGWDNTIRLWDAETGAQLHQLPDHVGPVTGLDWSPDGAHLASGSDDGTVRVWGLP